MLALLLVGASAVAQSEPLKSGEQVYRHVCSACHAEGIAHAPQVGDKKAWKPLIQEGQGVLTGHAWVGVRAMPPQGGTEDLSLEEFARAVAWMVRHSGGRWQDPDAAMMREIRKEARERFDVQIKAMQARREQLLD